MTERRRLEPLRLDRPDGAPKEPHRPDEFAPIDRGEHRAIQESNRSSLPLVITVASATLVLALSGATIAYFVSTRTQATEAPSTRAATPSIQSTASTTNDGTDASRPILAPGDLGFVDTRGGWGWSDRCWTNLKAGKLGWARAECDEGLKMNPASPQPRASLLYNHGLISKAAGNIEDARSWFNQSLALREHAEVRAALNSLP